MPTLSIQTTMEGIQNATASRPQAGQANQKIHYCHAPQCISNTEFLTHEELREHIVTKHKRPQDQPKTWPSGGRARPNPAVTVAWQASTIISPKSPDRGGPTDLSVENKPNMQDVQNSTSNLVISSPGPNQSQIKRENLPPSRLEHRATPLGNPKRTRAKVGAFASAFGRRKDPDFDRPLPFLRSPTEDSRNRTSKRLFNPDRDDAKTFNPTVDPGPRLYDEILTQGQRKEPMRHPGEDEQTPISIVQRNDAAGEPRAKDKDFPQPSIAVLTQHKNKERLQMVRQPETRPISPEQLIAEVKGIYAGLIMVEAKCCEVDAKQHQAALEMDGRQPTLNNEQWQALIALHRTLLHEHHDFFLASQHPSASPSLKRLAHKYAMPARMWRHGIHSFLEFLRHRLPRSLEHMLTFIYLAYSMMALLPAFEDTWIECLRDLGRYRMAIEDDDVCDKEVWQNVARFWYSKVADKTPYVGRLYHHLAILARPNILQQLLYYCKSPGVSQPFTSARESILTVFDPIFNPDVFAARSQPVDASFIQLHSITFTHIEFEKFDIAIDAFLDLLGRHINHPRLEWRVQGFYIAMCNITALYQYGAHDTLLRKAWKEGRKSQPAGDQELEETPPIVTATKETTGESAIDTLLPPYGSGQVDTVMAEKKDEFEPPENGDTQSIQEISLNAAKRLAFTVLSHTLERVDDNNVMPHCHAWMVLSHIINSVPAVRLLENEFPWRSLIEMLNELRVSYDDDGDGDDDKIMSKAFPTPGEGVECQLHNITTYGTHEILLCEAWKEAYKTHPTGDEEIDKTTDVGAIDAHLPPYGSEQVDSGGKDEIEPPENAVAPSVHKNLLNAFKRSIFKFLSFTLETVGNVIPHCHTWMEFFSDVINSLPAVRLIENKCPWRSPIEILNALRVGYIGDDDSNDISDDIASKLFPIPNKCINYLLPEDYNLQEFDWAGRYFAVGNSQRTQEPSVGRPLSELQDYGLRGLDWTRRYFAVGWFGDGRGALGLLPAVWWRRSIKFINESEVEMTAPGYRNSDGQIYRKIKEKKQVDIQFPVEASTVIPCEKPANRQDLESHISMTHLEMPKCSIPMRVTSGCALLERSSFNPASNLGKPRMGLAGKPPGEAGYQRSELLGSLDGHPVRALADSGSCSNIMSEDYASRNNLLIDRRQKNIKVLPMVTGKPLLTIGSVKVVWEFQDEPDRTYTIYFDVASKFFRDILLGKSFLQETKSLNECSYRLVPTQPHPPASNTLSINNIGESHQTLPMVAGLPGQSLGLPVKSLPDTGSEGDVMSLEFALKNNLELEASDTKFLLPDGTIEDSMGCVRLDLSFVGEPENRISTYFEVMRDCRHEIILGHDFVLKHHIFSDNVHRLIDTIGQIGLNSIILLRTRKFTFLRRRKYADPAHIQEENCTHDAVNAIAMARRRARHPNGRTYAPSTVTPKPQTLPNQNSARAVGTTQGRLNTTHNPLPVPVTHNQRRLSWWKRIFARPTASFATL